MRGDARRHTLVRPRTLGEALEAVAGGARPIAGGTDVMVLFAAGKLAWPSLVDLWGLDELRGVAVDGEHLTLGALTTYSDVQAHEAVRRELPMLCVAASETGGWAIQNRGTLGGNIANASPAADSPPALLAYGAEVELVSRRGARWVDYATFHTGYKQTVLAADELIARVRVPRGQRRAELYRKVGPRRAQAISKVCFAGAVDGDGTVRVALGGVAPVVLRCPVTETALAGGDLEGARAALEGEIAPIDDVRSTARYRRRVAVNLLGQFAERMGIT
jgi:CO/xanthine dehydrogenase FAD-binding subunit